MVWGQAGVTGLLMGLSPGILCRPRCHHALPGLGEVAAVEVWPVGTPPRHEGELGPGEEAHLLSDCLEIWYGNCGQLSLTRRS